MDLSGFKKIAINGIEMVKIAINGVQIWAKKMFTNQVPISTDTDGSIFNGVGYKENVRLSSSGGISGSAQNGSVTTGFIPFAAVNGITGIIRMKGVEWVNAPSNGHYYVNFYDGNKKFLDYFSSSINANGSFDHVVTATHDDATGIDTMDFNDDYGTSNTFLQHVRSAAFIRVTAYGKGADFILTVNEEID